MRIFKSRAHYHNHTHAMYVSHINAVPVQHQMHAPQTCHYWGAPSPWVSDAGASRAFCSPVTTSTQRPGGLCLVPHAAENCGGAVHPMGMVINPGPTMLCMPDLTRTERSTDFVCSVAGDQQACRVGAMHASRGLPPPRYAGLLSHSSAMLGHQAGMAATVAACVPQH